MPKSLHHLHCDHGVFCFAATFCPACFHCWSVCAMEHRLRHPFCVFQKTEKTAKSNENNKKKNKKKQHPPLSPWRHPFQKPNRCRIHRQTVSRHCRICVTRFWPRLVGMAVYGCTTPPRMPASPITPWIVVHCSVWPPRPLVTLSSRAAWMDPVRTGTVRWLDEMCIDCIS